MDLASQLNNQPVSLAEFNHAGALPPAGGFARCKGKGVRIEAIQESEDGKALILRAVEWFCRKRQAAFELPAYGRSWTATFRANEIKTFRIPDTRRSAVREVNMLEEPR